MHRATGQNIPSSHLLGPQDFKNGGGPPTCAYEGKGKYGEILLSVLPGTREEFIGRFRGSANADRVDRKDGPGPATYFAGCRELSAFDDGVWVQIRIDHPNCDAAWDLKGVGRAFRHELAPDS